MTTYLDYVEENTSPVLVDAEALGFLPAALAQVMNR